MLSLSGSCAVSTVDYPSRRGVGGADVQSNQQQQHTGVARPLHELVRVGKNSCWDPARRNRGAPPTGIECFSGEGGGLLIRQDSSRQCERPAGVNAMSCWRECDGYDITGGFLPGRFMQEQAACCRQLWMVHRAHAIGALQRIDQHRPKANLINTSGLREVSRTSSGSCWQIGPTCLLPLRSVRPLCCTPLKTDTLPSPVDLLRAGAKPEASTPDSTMPIHLAADRGHLDVVAAQVEAGANTDSRAGDGRTPLWTATFAGRFDAVRELLRMKANPLLPMSLDGQTGLPSTFVPLDAAAHGGHSEVVRELILQVGIEGCGGKTGGVAALERAAQGVHVDTMAALTEGGVQWILETP